MYPLNDHNLVNIMHQFEVYFVVVWSQCLELTMRSLSSQKKKSSTKRDKVKQKKLFTGITFSITGCKSTEVTANDLKNMIQQNGGVITTFVNLLNRPELRKIKNDKYFNQYFDIETHQIVLFEFSLTSSLILLLSFFLFCEVEFLPLFWLQPNLNEHSNISWPLLLVFHVFITIGFFIPFNRFVSVAKSFFFFLN